MPQERKTWLKAWRERNAANLKLKNAAWYGRNAQHVKARSTAWDNANSEKVKTRKKAAYEANVNEIKVQRREYNHGISASEYNEIFEKQSGCCAICQKHRSGFKKDLAVDHDHMTGKIRGLLCGNCNLALGLFFDNKSILETAATYLGNDNYQLYSKYKRKSRKKI